MAIAPRARLWAATLFALTSILSGMDRSEAAETGWMTAQSAAAKLLPLKRKLFEQGEYTKATALTCAVRGGKALLKFSYTTSRTHYYENSIFYAHDENEFKKMVSQAKSLGFGSPVDTCHLVGKKAGQELFVAIFNKPASIPSTVTSKTY